MKYKTTRKAVVNNLPNVKSAGYCELQTLLNYHSPNAYTCGVNGWNFDVYELPGLTICTGYSNMPGERVKGGREYEQKAEKIMYDNSIPWEKKQGKLEKLLHKFVVLNGGY